MNGMDGRADIVDLIVRFEGGELDGPETVELFSRLVASGDAWRLQGSYGRAAASLIDAGILDADGNIDWARYLEEGA
jgi:hypothetical protein